MKRARLQFAWCLWAALLLAGVAWPQNRKPDAAQLEQIGRQAYADRKAPGFSMLVWSHGSVIFARGYGFADLAATTPVTPGTRFVIGSITKQFTAACALLLAEQGRLSIDDRLARYFPHLPNADEITLRMLLNHISGLRTYPSFRTHNWPKKGAIAPKKLLDIFKTDAPDFAPGEKFEYSNTNYAVLAAIVAKVSGESYSDFLRQNIFGPLRMSSSGSGFEVDRGVATPYDGTDGNFEPPRERLSLDLFFGAGSIVSTAEDLAKRDAALIEGKFLNAQSTQTLWTHGTLSDGKPTHYAMGFVPGSIGGHREVWHNGYTPTAGGYCYNALFPDDQLAIIILSNGSDKSFRGEPEHMVREVLALYDPTTAPTNTAESASDSALAAAPEVMEPASSSQPAQAVQ
jgi:D-alanyl-D-alanine carboxypeptidase